MLLMIQCQKSIRFAPQNLHAIFAKRNWKKSFSGCINYFESNPKIRRDSAINGKYGSTKHETWIEQYLLNCIVQFRSQYLYDIASDFFFVISENELSVIYENISNFSSNTEEPKPLWCRIWIFLWFLKMNYMWFMGIFPICYFYCLLTIQLHEIFDPNFKWVLFTFVKNDSAKLVQHTCAAWIRDLLAQLFLDNSISSRQNKIYYQIFANVHQQTCDLWKTLLYVFLFVKCF